MRALLVEAVHCMADDRGPAWQDSILRPCRAKCIEELPNWVLRVIVDVWTHSTDDGVPPKGVYSK